MKKYLILFVVGMSLILSACDVAVTPLPPPGGTGVISGEVRTDSFVGNFNATPIPTSLTLETAFREAVRPTLVPGQVLVQFASSELEAASFERDAFETAFASEFGLEVLRSGNEFVPTVVLADGADTVGLAARLAADPRVANAEPNFYIYQDTLLGGAALDAQDLAAQDLEPTLVLNDTRFRDQWYLARSGIPVAWEAVTGSRTVTAVLDTAIDTQHPDFLGAPRFVSAGYDFCASANCTTRDDNVRPDNINDRHGTHVTGIIAARGANAQGIAGVLAGEAAILPVKVFNFGANNNAASTTANALIEAVNWAAGNPVPGVPVNSTPARIINMSLGTAQESAELRTAVANAQNRGALIIAASGNAGQGTVLAPASYAGVIGVGSINNNFRRACISNFGAGLDIMAAGGDFPVAGQTGCFREGILSTIPGNNYGLEIGTSQAAPIVSGTAALVWGREPNLTAGAVRDRLLNTAYYDAGYMNPQQYGRGILRADNALGMPGPGIRPGEGTIVTVTAAGRSTTTRLTILGNAPFSLTGLPAGNQSVTATATAPAGNLTGTRTLPLGAGALIPIQ